MIRNAFGMASKRNPRFVIAANILWVFIALLIPCMANATVVVLIIDHREKRIVVATDSKVAPSNPHKVIPAFTICKIFVMPNCTFAITGATTQPDTNFDVRELAKAACRSPGDLLQKADSFLTIAHDPAQNLARYIRQANPKYYAQ